MGLINLERDELDALKSIDRDELRKLVDKSLDEERTQNLRAMQLSRCGLYVANQLMAFEKAIAEYRKAKSARKRDVTYTDARRAGDDLEYAFNGMKGRAEEQEQESRLFFVDDHIIPPQHFTENLSVYVTYRWREVKEDDWKLGTIRFLHEAHKPVDYLAPKPKRKPPAWKVEKEKQDWLYKQWEHLMRLGLQSLKEFFREGGKASVVPKSFTVKVDARGELNNLSADFWR